MTHKGYLTLMFACDNPEIIKNMTPEMIRDDLHKMVNSLLANDAFEAWKRRGSAAQGCKIRVPIEAGKPQ